MNRNRFRNFMVAEGGVAAIEFAFIFPIMLFLFFAMIDFTGYVSYNRKITAVAGATADLVSQHRTSIILDEAGKTGDIKDYFKVAGMILKPMSDTNVRIQLYGYRMVGTTLTKIWQVDNGSAGTCTKLPPTADMGNLMVAGNDLIVSQVCMTYTPYIGEFIFGGGYFSVERRNYTLSGQETTFTTTLGAASFKIEEFVIQRPRSSAKLDCYLTSVASGTKCTPPA
jgi:Flp pilus assembly protein TadG